MSWSPSPSHRHLRACAGAGADAEHRGRPLFLVFNVSYPCLSYPDSRNNLSWASIPCSYGVTRKEFIYSAGTALVAKQRLKDLGGVVHLQVQMSF